MLCVVIWKARQALLVAGARAQAQAALGGKEALEAFTDFRDLVNRAEVADKSKKMKEALTQVQKIKEIRFQPMHAPEPTRNLPRRTR